MLLDVVGSLSIPIALDYDRPLHRPRLVSASRGANSSPPYKMQEEQRSSHSAMVELEFPRIWDFMLLDLEFPLKNFL